MKGCRGEWRVRAYSHETTQRRANEREDATSEQIPATAAVVNADATFEKKKKKKVFTHQGIFRNLRYNGDICFRFTQRQRSYISVCNQRSRSFPRRLNLYHRFRRGWLKGRRSRRLGHGVKQRPHRNARRDA